MSVTPQERLALGVVALLLATGVAARSLRTEPAEAAWSGPASEAAVGARLRSATADSVKRAEQRSRPLAPGERLDPNTAPADELQRLPRVGPAVAARIVAWREAHGRFGTLAGVDSVPGVGPAMLAGIAPHLALAPAAVAAMPRSAPRAAAARATIDLNSATAAELDALPGIGPALAERVVAYREQHGRFRSVDEMEKVPGIGPSLVSRVRARASATP